MKLKEWIDKNCKPMSVCAPPMKAGDAAGILCDEILGGGVLMNYPGNGEQALAEAVAAVVGKFRKIPWIVRVFL